MRIIFVVLFSIAFVGLGQKDLPETVTQTKDNRKAATNKPGKMFYGIASYYADHFKGRKTANGDSYKHTKLTAACNVLPLGTWIRVTNIKNKRTVIVRINDRLHPKNKRIVDLSYAAAQKLGYIQSGLTQVEVKVLSVKKQQG